MIKTVKDVKLAGVRVIMRVDFNVPMKDGVVQDDTRIMAAIPTIRYILGQKPRSLVLMSHLGDPVKDVKKAAEKAAKSGLPFDKEAFIEGKNRLKPVADYLAKKLGVAVSFAPSCMGQEKTVNALEDGGILMLENTRFHPEETAKDEGERRVLARELASYGDVYVNDAFGTAHRTHASTATITEFVPIRVGGLLMAKEVEYFEPIVHDPKKPLVAIIGGAKVSSKITVLEHLLKNAAHIVIGGGMAYTFLKAQGYSIGLSLFEEDFVDTAKQFLAAAAEKKVSVLLPLDHVGAERFAADAEGILVDTVDIPDNLMAMDIGEKTIAAISAVIKGARTIVWNGPMGVFEFEAFAEGTKRVTEALSRATKNGAVSVVGGGDSVAALNAFNRASEMSHVSTGGGASLEFLEGKTLPGIACLQTN